MALRAGAETGLHLFLRPNRSKIDFECMGWLTWMSRANRSGLISMHIQEAIDVSKILHIAIPCHGLIKFLQLVQAVVAIIISTFFTKSAIRVDLHLRLGVDGAIIGLGLLQTQL